MSEDEQPWYRTQTAVFAAGGLGLVLVVTLFAMVVRMSGEWENPAPELPRVTASYPSESTSPSILTPSSTTDTYRTGAPLSTTEIPGEPAPSESTTPSGPPGDETTTPTTPTTASTTTTTTPSAATTHESGAAETTTSRKRLRFNETRTVYQPPPP